MSFLPRLSFRRKRQHDRAPPDETARPSYSEPQPVFPSTATPPLFPPLADPAPAPLRGPAVDAEFDAAHVCFGAGVAIFHLASARVVVCYHPRAGLWFLPKGRKDVGEEAEAGAVREGYEEVNPLSSTNPVSETIHFSCSLPGRGRESGGPTARRG